MTGETVLPEECGTMAEIRAGVDALDRQIVALIGRRFRYMDAAARVKTAREHVRDEGRKAEVLANVQAQAAREDVPVAVIVDLYERLVEGSIAYELERFDALRAEPQSAPE